MKLSVKESLVWLRTHGFEMKASNYHRIKAKIEASTEKRKFNLMQKGLLEQHFERIDQLETIQKLMWDNYHREASPFRKTKILESLRALQPLLSAYYNATQDVIEFDTKKGIQPRGYLSQSGGDQSNSFQFFNI